jgi:hypothetical protein
MFPSSCSRVKSCPFSGSFFISLIFLVKFPKQTNFPYTQTTLE